MEHDERDSETEELFMRLKEKASEIPVVEEQRQSYSEDESLSIEELLKKLKIANSDGYNGESSDEDTAAPATNDSGHHRDEDDNDDAELEFDDTPITAVYENYNVIGKDKNPNEGIVNDDTDDDEAEDEDIVNDDTGDDEAEDEDIVDDDTGDDAVDDEDVVNDDTDDDAVDDEDIVEDDTGDDEAEDEDIVDDDTDDDAVDDEDIVNDDTDEEDTVDDDTDEIDGNEDKASSMMYLDISENQLTDLDITELFGFSEAPSKHEKDADFFDGSETGAHESHHLHTNPDEEQHTEEFVPEEAFPSDADIPQVNENEPGLGKESSAYTVNGAAVAPSEKGETSDASDASPKGGREAKKTPMKRSTPIDDESGVRLQGKKESPHTDKVNREYTSHSQTAYIKEGYKTQLKSEAVYTLSGALLFIVAFVAENLSLFGVRALSLAENPIAISLVSFILSLCGLFICMREAIGGAAMLIKGKSMPESAIFPLFAILSLYEIISFAIGGAPRILFGAAFCMFAFVCKLKTFMRLIREIKTFGVVSSEKPKRVLSALSHDMSEAEARAFGGYVDDEAECYCVKRALFYDGYFSNIGKPGKRRLFCGAFIIFSFFVAVVVFLVSYLTERSAPNALAYAAAAVFFTLPFSCALFLEMPLFCCADEAAKRSCAIVGEDAFDKLSCDAVISFSDNDIFPKENILLVNILLFGKENVEKILEYTALVFYEINSSVSRTILKSIPNYRLDDEITINEIYDDGIEAYINDERVLAGSRSFLVGAGIRFPNGYGEKKNGRAFLYVAIGEILVGRFDFDYIIDADICDSIRHIAESGKYIAVRTLDPNITPEFLAQKIDYENIPLKLIKRQDDRQLWRMRKRVSGPVASCGGTGALMHTLALCSRGIFWQKAGVVASCASFAAGCAVVAISLLMQNTLLLASHSVVLFQFMWTLVSFIPALLGAFKGKRRGKKKRRVFKRRKDS